MKVTLRPVTRDNLNAVLDLTVMDDQLPFVAQNILSLAQAAVTPALRPRAVYAEDTPVGFVMYGFDEEEYAFCIDRLMIDRRHQGKGYGREALRLAVEEIRDELPARRLVYLSVLPENAAAQALYERFGFLPDGRVADGEIVYRLDL